MSCISLRKDDIIVYFQLARSKLRQNTKGVDVIKNVEIIIYK